MEQTKMRRTGLRYRTLDGAFAHPGQGAAELYDIDTGEALEGVSKIDVHYSVDNAVTVTAEIFISEVKPMDACDKLGRGCLRAAGHEDSCNTSKADPTPPEAQI